MSVSEHKAVAVQRWYAIFALVLLGLAWFGGLGHRPLFKTDEGRYAEIPREMVVSGNWVTPRLDGLRYFEKPPLQYWATAVAYKVFGIHDWSARLWSALTSYLTIILAFSTASRLYGRRSGWVAGAILAGSFYFGLFGHTNTLDAGLTFAMALAIFGLALGLHAPPRSRSAPGWMLVAYAGAGLAVLSKGLIGIIFPGAVLALYILLKRDWRLLHRLYPVRGLALFFAITLPWFVAVSLQNHDFLWHFFMVQEFLRFLTPISHRAGPWWYFLPILLLAMVPWIGTTARAIGRGAKRLTQHESFHPATLLWLWVVFVFVFFSASHSKLPSYVLPIIPALAVLVAPVLVETRRAPRSAWGLSIGLGIVMLVASMTAPTWARHSDPAMVRALMPWVAAGGFLVCIAGLVAFLMPHRRVTAIVLVAASWLIATRLIMFGTAALAPEFSTRALVKATAAYNRPDVPVYSVGEYQQTLPFYLGRTMTLVAFQGELHFGIKHARNSLARRYIPTLQDFAQVWRDHRKGLAFAPRKSMPAIRHLGIHFQVVAQNPRWVAFVPETQP